MILRLMSFPSYIGMVGLVVSPSDRSANCADVVVTVTDPRLIDATVIVVFLGFPGPAKA